MPCSWSIMIKSESWTYPHASATCWVDLRPRKTWQAYLTFSGCFVTNPKSLGSRGWKPQKVTFFRLKKYSGAGAWKARSQSYQKLLKREKVLRLVCNLRYAFSASLWFSPKGFVAHKTLRKIALFLKSLLQCSQCLKNHSKSLTQHSERSKLRLYFEWTKVHQKCQKRSILTS